uniref:Putative structural protein n=1 Tax=viral metagenome TaxID=1070528 RepID=A0A6M3K581_9ZZZZ
MATYNSTVGDTALAYTDSHKAYVVKESITLQTEATALTTAGYFAAGDILQVFDIPANTFVLAAGLIPTVAEGTTLTYDLGDGTTADGFVDGLSGNATTAAHSQVAEAYSCDAALGKVYTATDTLDLKIVTMGAQVSHAAVVTVWMVCFDLN